MFLIRYVSIFLLTTMSLSQTSEVRPSLPDALSPNRLLSVRGIIQTRRIAGAAYFAYRPKSNFASFSPDGNHFVVILMQANIEDNRNTYSVLLFDVSGIFRSGKPKTILSLSSSSNRPAIADLKWSSDNDTLFFLGTVGNSSTQLYSVRCSSGELREITDHETSLTSYAVSSDGMNVVFEAEARVNELRSDAVDRYGFHVEKEEPSDLISGKLRNQEPELFVKLANARTATRLRTLGKLHLGYGLSLSPDSHYLVLKTDVQLVPNQWREYQDVNLQAMFRRGFRPGSSTGILQYEILDLYSGQTSRLLNAPASYYPQDVLWSPDSGSLILCGTFLPLDVNMESELNLRRAHQFIVEIDPKRRNFAKITDKTLDPISWQSGTNLVEFMSRWQNGKSGAKRDYYFFQKSLNRWQEVKDAETNEGEKRPAVLVEDDLNESPRLVAVDRQTARKAMLLELNPQLRNASLAKVETITWRTCRGKFVSGGLYLPIGYVRGKRYPLVIQTHGFDPHSFWLDGPYTTAFAAQALASQGIAVLQIDDIFYESLLRRFEADRVLGVYESAIAYLDRERIIDTRRVGLVGFSRTCYYVKYALTHAPKRFSAAVVADGVDAGYMQYLIALGARPLVASEFETMIGAKPFGRGLETWIRRSPGFGLPKVQAAVLIEALEPSSLLDEWEWFGGMKALGKPVDLLYLPGATHILVKPWERLASLEATVDWLSFWLIQREDPDPAKHDQYQRWRELRRKRVESASN